MTRHDELFDVVGSVDQPPAMRVQAALDLLNQNLSDTEMSLLIDTLSLLADSLPGHDAENLLATWWMLGEALRRSSYPERSFEYLMHAMTLANATASKSFDAIAKIVVASAIANRKQRYTIAQLETMVSRRWTVRALLAICSLLESLMRLDDATNLLISASERPTLTAEDGALILQRLGIIQERQGMVDAALATLQRAAGLLNGHSDQGLRGQICNSLSVELLNLGRVDEAARAADEAIESAIQAESTNLLNTALLTRGNVCLQTGQVVLALQHYHRALVASGQVGDRTSEALLLTNIAVCYLQLGQIRLYVDYITWALDTAIELDDREHRALALANVAGLQEPHEARVLYTEAWALYVGLGDLPNEAATLFGLARATRSAGQPEDALHFAKLAAERALTVGNLDLIAAVHQEIAQLHADAGRVDLAWECFRTAWEATEKLRRQTAAESVQFKLSEISQAYAQEAMTFALRQVAGSTAEHRNTWAARLSLILEESRARVAAEFMGRDTIAAATLPADVRNTLEQGREAVRLQSAMLAQSRVAMDPSDERLGKMAAALERAQRQLDEQTAYAEQSFPRFRLLMEGSSPTDAPLNANLGEAVGIIQYTVIDGQLVSVTRVAGLVSVRQHGDLSQIAVLDREITKQCGRVAGEDGFDDLVRQLYEHILAPIEETGILSHVTSLMVVPAPEVFGFPVEALRSDDNYVFERYTVTYLPGIAMVQLMPGLPERYEPALVIADPDGSLPYARQEAAAISRCLPEHATNRILIGDAASKEAYAREAPKAGLIHIATHAQFSADAATFSSILLAGGRTDHSRNLEIEDILNTRLKPSLVVLSGCDTGLSSTKGANEMIGFVRGFFASEASAVVATRWPVRDMATSEFMKVFYTHLIDGGKHPAEALTAARLELIRGGYHHPGLWAPFTYFGIPPD